MASSGFLCVTYMIFYDQVLGCVAHHKHLFWYQIKILTTVSQLGLQIILQ